jgi:hypothetical protein
MLAESILYDSIIYWLFTLEAPIYIGYSLEKLLYMAIFHNNNIVIAMAEGPAPNSACTCSEKFVLGLCKILQLSWYLYSGMEFYTVGFVGLSKGIF